MSSESMFWFISMTIVIYSDNMSDHIAQVQNVLRVLQDNGLYCKAEKCHFYKSEIKYLGYIISADGLRMDPSKISAVQSWPTPKKVRDLQVLLGIYKLLSCPIHDYSSMTANLTKLFKKDAPFVWGPEQEKSLQDLKTAFAKSDFLTHPDDSRPFILETDASDYAISGVLSQYDDSNTLRPIAFLCAPDEQRRAKLRNLRQRVAGCRRVIQTLAAFPPRRSPSCHRLVRPQELRSTS
ncbi:hypothetical protein BASA81_009231 [Batrachochytrium salamandrivorans]|nr:hypothetical protein BASA81_009231 [Batrachochytrium salamandrivorans]